MSHFVGLILAAGCGSRLGSRGQSTPKGFVEVCGKTLIHRSISQLRTLGVTEITIVTGHLSGRYQEEFGETEGINLVFNPLYAERGSLYSMGLGLAKLNLPAIVLDSDICYDIVGLRELASTDEDSAVLVSGLTNSGDEVWVEVEGQNLTRLSKIGFPDAKSVLGEFVGITKIGPELGSALRELLQDPNSLGGRSDYEAALSVLAQRTPIGLAYVENLRWGEIDTEEQIQRVRTLFGEANDESR